MASEHGEDAGLESRRGATCRPSRGRDVGRGPWRLVPRGVGLTLAILGVGCGASPAREADIYHDPNLRPGVVAYEGDAALLARLTELEGPGTVESSAGAVRVDGAYRAASGRRCRAVHMPSGSRLACEGDAGWVFVPSVLPTVPALAENDEVTP